jgi:hypothetical protein
MKFNITEKLNAFLNNAKDYPLLVGFISGFYPLVFFYSNNFESINSIKHLLFFIGLFLILPTIATYFGYLLISKSKRFNKYKQHFLFVVSIELTAIFFSKVYYEVLMQKRLFLLFVIAVLLSIIYQKHYKKIIVFLFLMCIIPIFKIAGIFYSNCTNSSDWQNQPDAILSVKFKRKPNVYYIQPDGFANGKNLKGSLYNIDNSAFDNWLVQNKFVLYDDFRSNYNFTLYSNLSCFFMKQHKYVQNSKFNYARNYIVGENPVIKIFKNNNYKTFFISDKNYFLQNKPEVAYDYCNFKPEEVDYFMGWVTHSNTISTIKNQMAANTKTKNFFFIQNISPGHIAIYESTSLGREKERLQYIRNLKEATIWLKKTISIIQKSDPTAVIIIGADHGGYVGFDSTMQSQKFSTDKKLLESIFGAKLAIKWNDSSYYQYDKNLKSSVNLFRILFSNLSQDKKLLNYLQPDISYNLAIPNDPNSVYPAIEN